MRLEKIKIHGMKPFEDAEIDLSRINGKVVAIVGKNGAGKSVLLEMWPGAMYRNTPTHGKLKRLAFKRDSYVTATIYNGKRYHITQNVDAHTKNNETLLLNSDNQPILDTTKVSDYGEWASRNLPDPRVFYSGPFAVQGRLGIINMEPAKRKSMLLKAIGVERYERMAKHARKKVEETNGKLNTLTARIADEKERGGDPDKALKLLTELTIALENAAGDVRNARMAYDRAAAASKDSNRALEIKKQRRQITTRIDAAKREITETERRIVNNRELIGRAEEIRDAVARTAEIDKALLDIRDRRKELEKMIAVADNDFHSLCKESRELTERELRLQREREEIERTLSQREAVEKAIEDVVLFRNGLERIEEEKNALEERNTEISVFLLTRKDERIDGLRGSLIDIAAVGQGDPIIIAHQGLLRDDEAAKRGEEAPVESSKNKKLIAELSINLKDTTEALRSAEGLAAKKPFLVTAEERHKTIAAEIEHNSSKAEQIVSNLNEKQAELKGYRAEDDRLIVQITPLDIERTKLERLAGMAEKLSQAEARIEELTRALEQARERAAAAEHELAATPELDVEIVNLAVYADAIKESERVYAERIESVARAKQALETSETSAQRIVHLTAELDAVALDLSDWTRLAQDLGRDGLQAIEIDAAVPELNEIANDLLHSAFGTRFTVSVNANKTSADGKEELEGLEIRMIDTEKGRDDLIEFYSGGEKVWGAEAIALAQTFMLCRSCGIERPTIARDETAGAMDPENGEAYVKMLRHAAEMIGADKIVFVSHSPAMQESADARIMIEDGSIEVL